MSDPSMKPTDVGQVRKNHSPLTNGTWVLVADGEKALFLRNDGDADFPVLSVMREDVQDNPKTSDQGTDRPGRFGKGTSARRGAVEETDWHWLEKERFAADLAGRLYTMAHAGRFDRLIVAAGPKILGELRQDMHREVTEKIVAEVDLTLTNHPIDEIAQRVAKATTPRFD